MPYLPRWFRRSPQAPKASRPGRRFRPLVEQLEDRRLLATFTVANLNDAGAGSLRQALLDANATAVADVIRFQVAGTVRLTSAALPAVTHTVTIDGTTAPGFAGTPRVEIDANGFGGLRFDAGSAGSALKSLGLVNASGDAVTLNAGTVTVVGNYLGLHLDGKTLAGDGGNGLTINASSSGDVIGGPGVGTGPSNVISGNRGAGIVINGSTNNVVTNNFIGTDAAGTKGRGNGGDGVLLTNGASSNTLGGTATAEPSGAHPEDFTGARPPEGNVISANGGNGVLLNGGATNNLLEGNFIGTAASGLSALGNALDGVALVHAPGNSLLGTAFPQDPFIYYNVVSGNGGNGLRISDSDNTTIYANFFGLGSDDHTAVGNHLDGVLVEGSSANTHLGGPIPLGNVDAANGQNGVELKDTVSGFTSFNTFCGAGAFVTATNLGNRLDGFLITSTGGNNVLLVNQVDNSGRNGIEICGEATGVQVTINIVGGYIKGTAAMPNHGNGVEVGGNAHGILIGGIPPDRHLLGSVNVFTANEGYGLAFTGTAHDNPVNLTSIGTNVVGNAKGGVYMGPGTYGNTIGSADATFPTIISGNLGDGITLDRTQSNAVIGTTIGIGPDGRPMPNKGSGVTIFKSSGNRVGGLGSGEGNTIAYNRDNGVYVKSGDRNGIHGNSIYSNGDLGIRLQDNANNRQAAPVLTAAVVGPAGGFVVSGTLTSTPNTTFVIELFANTSGSDQGRAYLGSVLATTNADGVVSFTFSGLLPGGITSLTATATDPFDNTSEFSQPLFLKR